jgi:hypothetical protein
MTADHNSLILMLHTLAHLAVSSEPLYLMPLLAPMLPILDPLVMLLVALLPAQGAVLVTPDCLRPQVFLRVAYQCGLWELRGLLENTR